MLAMNDGRTIYHHFQPAQSPFYNPYPLQKEWQMRIHAKMDVPNSNNKGSFQHSQSPVSVDATSNNNHVAPQSAGKPSPVENGSACPSSNSFNSSQSLKDTIGLLLYCSREYGTSVRSEELRKLVELFICQVFDSVSSQSTGSGSSSRIANTNTPPTSSSPSPALSSGSPSSGSCPSSTPSLFSSSSIDSVEYALQGDSLSCPVCYGVLVEPITLPCGHSYCKKCLKKENIGQSCQRCKYILSAGDVSNSKTNVLIGSLVEKWWPIDMKVTNLRNEGNVLFEKKELEQALTKYTEALNLSAEDHLSFGNRSHALLTAGRSEEALQDAESATKCCPTWPKGYFRKSAALISLGRYEEAFLSLTICMYLIKATSKSKEDPALSQVINEMMKIFQKIFLQSPVLTGCTLKRHNSEQLQFTPYPSGKKLNGRSDRRRPGYSNWNDSSEYNSSGDEADHSMYSSHQAEKNCSVWKPSRTNHHEASNSTHHHNHNSIVSNFTHSSSPLTEQLNMRINRLFGRASQDLKCFELRLKGMSKGLRQANQGLISSNDVECSLCYRLLYQPVSTSCGHTFCRCCLERCLDHNPACPLCKTSLQNYLVDRFNRDHSVTEFLESAIRSYLPKEYEERLKQHLEELNAVPSEGKNPQDVDVPIFVCTMAFPTIPCPLHVFEPRYRLMIRRCMENGTNKFGMCCYDADGEHNYGNVGTLLEIRNIRYFSDGRSVVDTVGCRRFRVLQKSIVDGYNAAKIELLHDRPLQETDIPIVDELHNRVFKEANEWLQSIGQVRRQRIHSHFGMMPAMTDDWRDSPDGPSWTWWLLAILPLDSKAQLAILSMSSLRKRLECILKVLSFVKNRMNSMGGEEQQPQQQS